MIEITDNFTLKSTNAVTTDLMNSGRVPMLYLGEWKRQVSARTRLTPHFQSYKANWP